MVAELIEAATLDAQASARVAATAADLVRQVRGTRRASPVDALMRQYDLSSEEGLALMELAEALLRIPDPATRDLLIRDKIGGTGPGAPNWDEHSGRSPSRLVNVATMGLKISSQMLDGNSTLGRMVARVGAPIVRGAIGETMKLLGDRFVFAETIEGAMNKVARESRSSPATLYSFDMLGEAARTYPDAGRYREAYSHAIAEIGKAAAGTVIARPGISVKISALHPRYELTQSQRLQGELLPGLVDLAHQAADAGISFTVDAEEADRLDLSLDVFEHLALSPRLAGWDGLGLAVQAYGKRALPVIDFVEQLARRSRRRIMVRLVKGAYWDSEIKRAQQEGLSDYPVYTRKVATDVSYLAAARRMLRAAPGLYPMFATHNAYTVAAIYEMAAGSTEYEFQRLHGMGEELHSAASAWKIPCRIYAPVGPHRDLLAYLVRRLLENGANSSFVNQIADASIPVEQLSRSPVETVRALGPEIRNPRLPLPAGLYEGRCAAGGVDFGDPDELERLENEIALPRVSATPLVGGEAVQGTRHKLVSPADRGRVIGDTLETPLASVAEAARLAEKACSGWTSLHVSVRSSILRRAADLMEKRRGQFLSLLVHEGGRTIRNAVGEWREAIDFLRYYARQAEFLMCERDLPGPTGESNRIALAGKGVFACISPWNFPLSIFIGQVAAALATGNTVIAKPAGETPLIGFEAVRLLHEAGVPANVLHYLPGGGEIGSALVSQPQVAGVVFTGSTATARRIAQALAGRQGPLATLIAETGGQNAMIVDSSALLEQAAADALASAFDSAGQRCSALRILAVQDDIADKLIEMIAGAMKTLVVGDPAQLSTDIGPVIHEKAREGLISHLMEVRDYGTLLAEAPASALPQNGSYFAPRLIEIDSIDRLTHEVFGPILHVVRWKAGELEKIVAQVNATGYGLTLGLQTRIDATVETVRRLAKVGNVYVNRTQIGAMVESQPFGGEGLSGTGPKAGGPHYLTRFAVERVTTINTAASGGNAHLLRDI